MGSHGGSNDAYATPAAMCGPMNVPYRQNWTLNTLTLVWGCIIITRNTNVLSSENVSGTQTDRRSTRCSGSICSQIRPSRSEFQPSDLEA